MDQPDKVTVRCALSAGVVLTLHEEVQPGNHMPWPTKYRPRTDVRPVTLAFGDTAVDAGFFGEWLAQNADNDLVTKGWVKRWPPQEQQ